MVLKPSVGKKKKGRGRPGAKEKKATKTSRRQREGPRFTTRPFGGGEKVFSKKGEWKKE